MYNSYEEYMQNVLGYNTPNTYRENENYYYDVARTNLNMQEVNKLYPEIYSIVYPVVQKVCTRRNLTGITEEQISQMVDEVYNVIEPGDDVVETSTTTRNGDVKNQKAKETRRPPSKNNYLLRDLIRILIIRELLQGGGRPLGYQGSMGIGRPDMNYGIGQMPNILRPGNIRMF